jgi:hypothetical protein
MNCQNTLFSGTTKTHAFENDEIMLSGEQKNLLATFQSSRHPGGVTTILR